MKGSFRWEFEAILRDLDGTLGTGVAGGVITPNSNILDKTSCTVDAAWSHGFEAVVCDDNVSNMCIADNEFKRKQFSTDHTHGFH